MVNSFFNKKYFPLLFVSLLFLVAELFIKPTGEFPLNDDWAYSKAIKYFLETGDLKISNKIAIPFVTQFFIGAVVCKIFGFSFFALRMISILLTLGSLFYFNRILTKISFSAKNQFAILCVFIFNPLVFSIGNTFLPDTIILFFAVSSFYYMLEYLSSSKRIYFLLFTLLTLLGTLNRQTGLLIPLIFGVIYIISRKLNSKTLLVGLIPFFLSILSLIVYEYIARLNNLLPVNYNMQLYKITSVSGLQSLNFLLLGCYFLTSITTLGVFIFPLVISNFKSHLFEIFFSKRSMILFFIFLLLLFYKSFFTIWYMPFVGNMFYPVGTGPIIINDFNSDKLILTNYNISFGIRLIYIIISFIGSVSFFFSFKQILVKLMRGKWEKSMYIGLIFILLFIIYLGMITLNYPNDRYLLFLVPFFFIAYIVSFDFNLKSLSFYPSFALILFFTLSTTFDYFSINNARWKGIYHLKSELKIKNEKIDGGFEFNAFYLEGRNDYKENTNYRWVVDDEYIISATKIKKNYSVESEYPFKTINSYPFKKIYILKRD